MRNEFQGHLARVMEGDLPPLPPGAISPIPTPPLPAGSISPVPDPDTNIPDAEARPPPPAPHAPPPPTPSVHVIDLITPQAPTLTINLITPEPGTSPAPTPTPPWPKRECSPERGGLAKRCAKEVHKNKGWQAVQGASPLHDTEESLRAVPNQLSPQPAPSRHILLSEKNPMPQKNHRPPPSATQKHR